MFSPIITLFAVFIIAIEFLSTVVRALAIVVVIFHFSIVKPMLLESEDSKVASCGEVDNEGILEVVLSLMI